MSGHEELVERCDKLVYAALSKVHPDLVPPTKILYLMRETVLGEAFRTLETVTPEMREAAWKVWSDHQRERLLATGGSGDLAYPGWETAYFLAMLRAAPLVPPKETK